MWIYVATSFTRYRKAGIEAQRKFAAAMKEDGFHRLHANLYVRYCTTAANAAIHRERAKQLLPQMGCDVSIILVPDSQEQNVYHCLMRRCKNRPSYGKPSMVEFL